MSAKWCGAMTVLLALCGGLSADDKKDAPKIDPAKLVGKWTRAKQGGSMEFTKDGKLFAAIPDADGGTIKAEGTYTLDGNRLTIKVRVEGKELTSTSTVTKLTDAELVTVNDGGEQKTYTRLKDK
jgi:uncharacterized protein (TIGR03066 family)